MALDNSTVWDIRISAGSDNNGGGFVPGATGTDYSQQNSPQFALTGIASAGSGNTILSTSAASTMIGNIAQVISGTNFNVGFYQITSVSAGVSITFSTNNASASICTGVGASGVINIGGALATISQFWAAKSQGNKGHVKASGTYTVTTTQNIAATDGGTANNITTLIGYTTTRGDGGKVTWTTATNSVDLITFAATGNVRFRNFNFTCTAGTPGNGITAGTAGPCGNIQFYNCIIDGFNIGMNGPFIGTYAIVPLMMINCEIKNCVSHGLLNSYALVLHGCYIHNNGGDGIRFGTSGNDQQSAAITHCVIYSNAGRGIGQVASAFGNNSFVYIQNSAFVSNTSDGIGMTNGNNSGIYIVNSIFVSNGGYGFDIQTNAMHLFSLNNAFYNNTTAPYSAAILNSQGDITMTGTPFNNPSGADFSLNNTPSAGAFCRQVGFPGTSPMGVGNLDVGPLQIAGGSGGAGGSYGSVS